MWMLPRIYRQHQVFASGVRGSTIPVSHVTIGLLNVIHLDMARIGKVTILPEVWGHKMSLTIRLTLHMMVARLSSIYRTVSRHTIL